MNLLGADHPVLRRVYAGQSGRALPETDRISHAITYNHTAVVWLTVVATGIRSTYRTVQW